MTEPRSNPIVACLAGDGIGPEVMAEAGRVIEAVSSLMGARVRQVHLPFGGDAIDKHQHPFPSHVRAAVRASDAVLLGAVGGPTVGVGSAPPRGRAARAAQGARHVRQPAARAPRGHRPDRCARADRRALLRREGADRRQCVRHLQLLARADRAGGEVGVPAREAPLGTCCLGGQGQRPRHVQAVAAGRDRAPRRGGAGAPAHPRARRLVRDEPGHAAGPLRRDPDREPVRRHPERSRRRGGRRAGPGARRPRSARTAPASSSRCTARRPTSRARARRTRSR